MSTRSKAEALEPQKGGDQVMLRARPIAVGQTVKRRPVQRRDAALNREKLIGAAREVMRDFGGDVPFERIAEIAGVTRGTMYRNFEDRQALYEVVLDHELESMMTNIDALPQSDTLGFLSLLTEMMMVYDKFLSVFPSQPDYKADGRSENKIAEAIAPPLARAQASGTLRVDLTTDDIQLASRMLAANWRLDFQSDLNAALDRRLVLMLKGLTGPPATPFRGQHSG